MLTNCDECGEEIDQDDVCYCAECGLDGICEDCLANHECADTESVWS